jgi:hypothetical protein
MQTLHCSPDAEGANEHKGVMEEVILLTSSIGFSVTVLIRPFPGSLHNWNKYQC